jgi:uncharacterized protein (UPF0548 family)
MPAGYRHVEQGLVLGQGRALFDAASAALSAWGMHAAAGMRVAGCATPSQGATIILSMGRWPLEVQAPCRVVRVIDEPDRRGFIYGTLPGHPEIGEESFQVGIDADGYVRFAVRAFSRPATWWARLCRPANRLIQDVMTRRYLAAMKGTLTSP